MQPDTREKARAALKRYAKENGQAAAHCLIKETCGTRRLSQVSEERLPMLLAATAGNARERKSSQLAKFTADFWDQRSPFKRREVQKRTS